MVIGASDAAWTGPAPISQVVETVSAPKSHRSRRSGAGPDIVGRMTVGPCTANELDRLAREVLHAELWHARTADR
jgi:hypothetical protein